MKNVKKFLVSMLLVVVLAMCFSGTSLAYAREKSEFITSNHCSCIDVKGDYALIYCYDETKEFAVINYNTGEVLFEELEEEFFPTWLWRTDSYITESGYIAGKKELTSKSPNYIINFITGDVSEPIYAEIDHISERYAILKYTEGDNNRYSIYNCIEKTFTELPKNIKNLWINDGDFIVIYYEDGHCGVLNYVTGEIVFESDSRITDIKNGFICLEYETKYEDKEEIVDFSTGRSVLSLTNVHIDKIINSDCAIIYQVDYENNDRNIKYGLINFMKNEMVLEFTEDNIYKLSDDYVAIANKDETLIFNVNNHEIVARGPWCEVRFHDDRYIDVWTEYKVGMVVQGLFDVVKEELVIEPQRVRARRRGEYHNCGIDVYKNFAVIYTKNEKEVVDLE